MPRIHDITGFLNRIAPLNLAEQWDNVGLLVGDDDRETSTVMTCLTLTPNVAIEAAQHNAQLIVSHHPILFRPVQQITAANSEGRMLLGLVEAGIAVYSPHTAYDSARDGGGNLLDGTKPGWTMDVSKSFKSSPTRPSRWKSSIFAAL